MSESNKTNNTGIGVGENNEGTVNQNIFKQVLLSSKSWRYILGGLVAVIAVSAGISLIKVNVQNSSGSSDSVILDKSKNNTISIQRGAEKTDTNDAFQTAKSFYEVDERKFQEYRKELNLSEAVLNDFIQQCYTKKVSFNDFKPTLIKMAARHNTLPK